MRYQIKNTETNEYLVGVYINLGLAKGLLEFANDSGGAWAPDSGLALSFEERAPARAIALYLASAGIPAKLVRVKS